MSLKEYHCLMSKHSNMWTIGIILIQTTINNKNYLESLLDKLSCKKGSESRATSSKKQKPIKLPRKGLDQLSLLARTLSNLGSCLQALKYAPYWWDVTHVGVGFGDTPGLASFLFL